MTRLNPYINFKDNARQAMEFYKGVFGGELVINTFKDANMAQAPSDAEKVMHAMLEAENGITFMASDTPAHMAHTAASSGDNISMSLSGEEESLLKGYWEKLAVDATIDQPLVTAPWGDTFGMLTDKFGIHWMVNIAGKKA